MAADVISENAFPILLSKQEHNLLGYAGGLSCS